MIGPLVLPGEMLPVLNELSSATMSCVLLSALCQATVLPTPTAEGLGENEFVPAMPTISIVTSAGAGGDEGFDDELLLQPPTEANAIRPATAIATPHRTGAFVTMSDLLVRRGSDGYSPISTRRVSLAPGA